MPSTRDNEMRDAKLTTIYGKTYVTYIDDRFFTNERSCVQIVEDKRSLMMRIKSLFRKKF